MRSYTVDLETLDRELGDSADLPFVTRSKRSGTEISRGKLGRIKGRIEDLTILGGEVYAEIFPDFWVEVTP